MSPRWFLIEAQTTPVLTPIIRYLSQYHEPIAVSVYYAGADVPVLTHNGTPVTGTPLSGNRYEYTIPYDGTPDQEVLIFGDNANQFYFPNSVFSFLRQYNGITFLDLSKVTGVVGIDQRIGFNEFFEIIMPDGFWPTEVQWNIVGMSGVYEEYQPVKIWGNGSYGYININNSFTRAHLDLTELHVHTYAAFGGVGNTSTTGNSCYLMEIAETNESDFEFFRIGGVYQAQDFDLSGWTGNFSGYLQITNQGLGPKGVILPPNIHDLETIWIGNHRTLGTQVIAPNNGEEICTSTTIYRNVLNNALYRAEFDLTNWNMAEVLNVFSVGDFAAYRVHLPASNPNNFHDFRYSNLLAQPSTHLDLSGWTGEFTDNFEINNNNGIQRITMPPNISGIKTFSIQRVENHGNYGLTISGITLTDSFSVHRNDAGGTGANRILNITGNDFQGLFRVDSYADNRPQNWRQVLFPAINTNDFYSFGFGNIGNMTSVDFSGWTGEVVGTGNDLFQIWGLYATTSLLIGFSRIEQNSIIIRNNELLDFYFEIGVQMFPRQSLDFSKNALSTANIDAMIDDIEANQALLEDGITFNFSRWQTTGSNSAGTNGVPSAGSIAKMATLSGSPKNFQFIYWNGGSNVMAV